MKYILNLKKLHQDAAQLTHTMHQNIGVNDNKTVYYCDRRLSLK